MATNAELKQLKLLRKNCKSTITRTSTYLEKINDLNIDQRVINEVKARLHNLIDAFHQFNEAQTGIEFKDENADSEALDLERNEVEDKYFSLRSRFEEILQNFKVNIDNNSSNNDVNTLSSNQDNNSPTNIPTLPINAALSQLYIPPLMKLPTFNGDYNQWVQFRDSFKALIDNNPILSDVQKFYHLRGALERDVLETISAIPVTDRNYALAWQTLTDRYERSQLIIRNHVRQILDCPRIQKESAKELRNLYNHINNNLEALKNLNEPIDQWNALLIPIVSDKLDINSRQAWEKQCTMENSATIRDLFKLIQSRCEVLENIAISKNKTDFVNFKQDKSQGITKYKSQSAVHISTNYRCYFCNKNHTIYQCSQFLNLKPQSRYTESKKRNLCINCLKPSHSTFQCKSSKCRECGRLHNSLLHYATEHHNLAKDNHPTTNSSNEPTNQESKQIENTFTSQKSSNQEETTVPVKSFIAHSIHNNEPIGPTLLSTAQVLVKGSNTKILRCRALLDNGAMSNFITKEFCDKLKLKPIKINYAVTGLGDSMQNIQYMVQLTFSSIYNNFTTTISCLVLPKITCNIPFTTFQRDLVDVNDNINLADPDFNESKPIDLLLGSNIFWSILCHRREIIPNTQITIQETKLGWIFGGQSSNISNKNLSKTVNCCSINTDLDNLLTKFWNIEEINSNLSSSPEDIFCEKHFLETHMREDQTGKFIASIPFKNNLNDLGSSRETALKQFYSLERRLLKNVELYKSYTEFMKDYHNLSHMEEITENQSNEELNYYIPHHAVIRENSQTTKTRVVFNASMKTESGLSLNNVQYVGPTIQTELFSILLNFRLYNFVISADISKMYRMIWINSDQRRFHRIFWRNNTTEKIRCYELKTITYGTASAPYLAIRCLHQLALENKNDFPTASQAILNCFYVDDLLYGSDSEKEIIQVQKDVTNILSSAGFELRKWLCNKPNLYREFKINHDLECSILQFGANEMNATLGIGWNAVTDNIHYISSQSTNNESITKRTILSKISQIFDPLGLLGPIVILGKLLIQQLWQERLDWDDEIPQNLANIWLNLQYDFTQVSNLKIPRQVLCPERVCIELHGFSDASEKAFAAVVYLRCKSNTGAYSSKILCAKSRVAPLKQITLPRLELCSALLLSRLIHKILKSMQVSIERTFLWSDSQVTLSWIRACPSKWRTFVANRVSEIQSLTNVKDWNHVRSNENPADILSRGTTIEKLKDCNLWWSGPSWLLEGNLPNNKELIYNVGEPIPEMRTVVHVTVNDDFNLFRRYSKLRRLQRVVAYIFRFIYNIKRKKEERMLDVLSVSELKASLQFLIRVAQQQSFPDEYHRLSNSKQVSPKSSLLSLRPFMDEDKLIRLGGRLQKSNLEYNKRHPIILPPKHQLTKMIFSDLHEKLLHCGPTQLLCSIREHYWPISGRNQAKNVVRQCRVCFLAKPKNLNYLMGNLPDVRINSYLPFYNVGTDYAGPFLLKDRRTRGAKIIKGYVCLFVCLSTKAVHLEVVSDLTTECFLACLRRFIGRRGKPAHIYSDNAKNYVGANTELKAIYAFVQNNSSIIRTTLSQENITWHFIPPRAPSFGGIWEAGIKKVKHHLKRVIGDTHITFEEFYTILCQIEAILNSRPLCPLTTNPDDLDPLTPGHFIIGKSLTSLPESNYEHIKENRLGHYEKLQKIIQTFWIRWKAEYLSELQVRSKWRRDEDNQKPIQVDDLVVLKEDNVSPTQWPLGRIVELHPGDDGIVRVVSVKVRDGIIKRSIRKVCILPNGDIN